MIGMDGCEFPGMFNFYTKVLSEAILSDYNECLLYSVIFGSCLILVDEEGGIILTLALLQLFPQLDKA